MDPSSRKIGMARTLVAIIPVLLVLLVISCKHPPADPDPEEIPESDITLDELEDKTDYPETMVVDCRYFNGVRVESLIVNGTETSDPVTIDLSSAGYYRIEIITDSASDPHVIRLVIMDPERGDTEWGLPPWTPRGVQFEALGTQEVRLIYPRRVPEGAACPLIVVVEGELTHSPVNLEAAVGPSGFRIKRGTGSVWIPDVAEAGTELVIDQRSFPIQPAAFGDPPMLLSGTLNGNTLVPSGTHVHVPDDLTIPSGVVLTFDSGVFVTVAPQVNIVNEGSLVSAGAEGSPITFTCSDPEAYWGGVIGRGSGNLTVASHTIFGRSGFHTGGDYNWGHAHRQALFYSENGSIQLDHCYMIDHIGQVLYTESATVEMSYCLVQRVKTGGQLNTTEVTVDHCVFTDFPDDSDTFRDEDNDGLYLAECVAVIDHSVFMYAKDDGLDSGSSASWGYLTVRDTRFESIFHEGAAMSGGSNSTEKIQRFYNCLFQDCGQGLELGFSSWTHLVYADSCLFLRNGVGIRYGDNYDYPNNGYMYVSNSESLENLSYDVWNMDREDWVADTSHLELDNVWVTKANPMYPELRIKAE